MSNLLKSFYTNQTSERVIDYNEVISNKIESFKSKIEKEKIEADGFVSGLDADVVEGLIADDSEFAAAMTGDFDPLSELVGDKEGSESHISEDDLRELAGNILSDANEKAAKIIEEAQKEAEAIKAAAFAQGTEEGRKRGYEQGVVEGQEQYQAMINNANAEQLRLQKEYETRYQNMESEIVDTLLEVFANVTHTISEDNKEIVLHLINQVMNKVEATGDILIKVSKDDYHFLVENQGKIYCSSPKDINISILEDSSVEKNQCIIETNGGVFESSLDIQLEQLIKDIKLLSCI